MMPKQVAATAGGVEGCDTTLRSSGDSACTAAEGKKSRQGLTQSRQKLLMQTTCGCSRRATLENGQEQPGPCVCLLARDSDPFHCYAAGCVTEPAQPNYSHDCKRLPQQVRMPRSAAVSSTAHSKCPPHLQQLWCLLIVQVRCHHAQASQAAQHCRHSRRSSLLMCFDVSAVNNKESKIDIDKADKSSQAAGRSRTHLLFVKLRYLDRLCR